MIKPLIILFTPFFAVLTSCTKENTSTISTDEINLDKKLMLSLINNVRSTGCKCGTKTMPKVNLLAWSDTLAKAAFLHSADMNQKNYFSHTNKENLGPGERLRNLNYIWYACGENIAKGQQNEEQVMNSWITSPGHCENIMSPLYKFVGVARVNNYWTQVFASK